MNNGKLVFHSAEEAIAAIGRDLGQTDWLLIDQNRVNLFADATGDHQWIHVDVARANAEIGGTIAHGFLTLSLVNYFLPMLFRAEGMKSGINYGCGKVRFPAPVKTGKRVHASAVLQSAEPAGPGAVQTVVLMTISVEGQDKPACVAESIGRYFF